MYISTALQVAFDQAVADAGPLLPHSHHATALSLYALYQQATLGDISEARPGFGDFAARARWDAWQALQGTPSSLAMQDYVELVASLKAAHRSAATG
jgi:acyl-CoA-binding protein